MKIIILSIIFLFQSLSVFGCEVTNLTLTSVDPVSGKPFELKYKEFKPKQNSDLHQNKQVVILPPIGGTTLLEDRYAKKVCAKGVNAYVFVNWTDDMEESVDDLAVHNRGTLRGLHAVEIFLDNYTKPTRILGTSLGGLYAGIAVGKFGLIEKAAIIASGTNLPQILATSSLSPLKSLKQKRYEIFKFSSEDDYAQEVKKHLSVEASDFKYSLINKKLLFFRTRSDTVIRPEFQDELINLFSKENVTVYHTRFGHTSGIVYTSVRRANLIASFLSN